MRILSAVLIWILFVGGLFLYTGERSRPEASAGHADTPKLSADNFEAEITTSFTAEPDPFAVRTETGSGAAALLLRLGDRELLRLTENVSAGEPIRVSPLSGLTAGENEIFVEASPPLNEAARSQAVRVRILRNGIPVADETFWSSPGATVTGALRFETEGARP